MTFQPLAVLDEVFMLGSAGTVAAGWVAVRHHHLRAHRRLMLTGAGLALAFFVTYVVKTFTVGDTAFGGPHAWFWPYQIFLQIHTIFATLAGLAGVVTLRWALRRRFQRHRRVAPWTAAGWMVTAASGLTVFLLLYVIFPTGPTTNNLIKLLLKGH
jgi:putative membrane protein